jgi:hypothetical protein
MTGIGCATEVVGWVGQLFAVVAASDEPESVVELPDDAPDAPELDAPELAETPEDDEEEPFEAASGPEPPPWVPGEEAPLPPQAPAIATARTREPKQIAPRTVISHLRLYRTLRNRGPPRPVGAPRVEHLSSAASVVTKYRGGRPWRPGNFTGRDVCDP